MNLPRNVGGLDRIVRGVLGVWLVVVALAAYLDDRRTTATVAGVAGTGLLQNAVTGFCGCNALLDIDTTSEGVSAEVRNARSEADAPNVGGERRNPLSPI